MHALCYAGQVTRHFEDSHAERVVAAFCAFMELEQQKAQHEAHHEGLQAPPTSTGRNSAEWRNNVVGGNVRSVL